MDQYQALVLAGRRGANDPLAEGHGATHRALLPVAGVPMLVRVVRTLRTSRQIGRIAISIDEPPLLDSIPELQRGIADGELLPHRSLDSPSRSVCDALDRVITESNVLITTADHALLSRQIVEHFLASADDGATDVAVGVVAEAIIRAAYPQTTRTYLRFREGGYSGANLFAFRGPAAARAAAFWVDAEQFRKRPWRLASVFGPTALALFALRRLTLRDALVRASRAIGCEIRAIPLPLAEAAIDVDRPSDLALVEKILASRPDTPNPTQSGSRS